MSTNRLVYSKHSINFQKNKYKIIQVLQGVQEVIRQSVDKQLEYSIKEPLEGV